MALVTPLRDGMNLVAKEFIAAQDGDDPGVLVLSQFAGAAAELDGALIVNPHEAEGVAAALKRALEMPLAERRERHAPMLEHLLAYDVELWAESFLSPCATRASDRAWSRVALDVRRIREPACVGPTQRRRLLVDRIQHLVPAPDGGDDFIGVGGPGEGRGLPIVLFEESIDGGLQIDDRSEFAALEFALGERGEEAFDGVEPRAGRRREVEDEPLVPSEPLEHFGMLVGGVIVEDHMHHLAGGNPSVDGVEKADELLMAVALHVLADDRAVENIHGGDSVVVPFLT